MHQRPLDCNRPRRPGQSPGRPHTAIVRHASSSANSYSTTMGKTLDPASNLMLFLLSVVALLTTLLGPVYLPALVATDVAMAGVALAGWLGLYSDIPSFLAGRPGLATVWALFSGGVAAKVLLNIESIQAGWPRAGAWVFLALLAFVSGKPLNPGQPAVAPPPLTPPEEEEGQP